MPTADPARQLSSSLPFPPTPRAHSRNGLIERFRQKPGAIVRIVVTRNGEERESLVAKPRLARLPEDIAEAHDVSWLRSATPPPASQTMGRMRIADLFCGCGGLSLGAAEAARAMGLAARFVFAADANPAAMAVYRDNFAPTRSVCGPVEDRLDGQLRRRLTSSERLLRREVGEIDLAVSGPPCQGHSDLNNHTRREDPKNLLVLRVARFVEVFEPRHVLIENVQGIRHDRSGSLARARARLTELGYSVTDGVISALEVGIAQRRKRYFLFASRDATRPLADMATRFHSGRPTVEWAIGDLERHAGSVFDTASQATPRNRARIDYLFDNGLFDLPDDRRPTCHAHGDHTYKAVYGRLHWDEPAQTITTGFGCMGQGRYVHPAQRRTLTPHEAARLQFFPDFFSFGERRRGEYQQMIGNAVPPKLAYAVLLHQLA